MLNRADRMSLREIFVKCFDSVFVADGVTPDEALLSVNEPKPITRASTFLGFPNLILDERRNQSFKNLFFNFVGYQPNVSRNKKIRNALLMPFVILTNILFVPLTSLKNITKIFTEFLPKFGINFFGIHVTRFLLKNGLDKDNHTGIRALCFVLSLLNMVPTLACYLLYAVGSAITSPVQAVRNAWHSGESIGGLNGKIISLLGVAFSIAVTFSAYALLFPLAIKVGGPFVVSAAKQYLPTVMNNAFNAVSQFITPALSAVGTKLIPVVQYVMFNLTLHFYNPVNLLSQLPLAPLGLSGLVGLITPTIGQYITNRITQFKKWWHKPSEPSPAPSPAPSSKTKPEEGDKNPYRKGSSYHLINERTHSNKNTNSPLPYKIFPNSPVVSRLEGKESENPINQSPTTITKTEENTTTTSFSMRNSNS